MPSLNKMLLSGGFVIPDNIEVSNLATDLPERVIQFGEGNFLRAFVDWMFHSLNKQGLFNGKVVVVQPIAEGLVDVLNRQDGLYTLILRGLKDGLPYEKREIISSISRGINPYSEWQEYLKCAENPNIEFVVSNTTEAGIAYSQKDSLGDTPPASFPAKLAVYLYHRFSYFHADSAKGMTIIPCELIDRNGDNLKRIILHLADEWNLPEKFKEWIDKHNLFVNTLVDRVVTGYPRDEISRLTQELGYTDELLDTGELFHLWVIEGPAALAEKLPLDKAGLDVVWTADMTPYRTRKVRILNGAHTASVPAAFLYGLDTVKEMMDHPVMGEFVRRSIYEAIIPSVEMDRGMLTSFANAVVERFQNPFIKHYLSSIMLNSSSKFKTRVLPSIHGYYDHLGTLPESLVFSLASLIVIYKDGIIEGSAMNCSREQGAYVMKDDLATLHFFADVWCDYNGCMGSAEHCAKMVLGNTQIWGEDLNAIPALTSRTAHYLHKIATDGIKSAMNEFVGGCYGSN